MKCGRRTSYVAEVHSIGLFLIVGVETAAGAIEGREEVDVVFVDVRWIVVLSRNARHHSAHLDLALLGFPEEGIEGEEVVIDLGALALAPRAVPVSVQSAVLVQHAPYRDFCTIVVEVLER
jgi:hypothetical protein